LISLSLGIKISSWNNLFGLNYILRINLLPASFEVRIQDPGARMKKMTVNFLAALI
jgi:hypothetical protein